MEHYLYYLSLGAFAGVLAGLLGVGGGLIIVPVLVFVFQSQGVSDAQIVHLAVGTSLATIVFTSISSVRAHHLYGAVSWPVFVQLAPGIIIGAWAGAATASLLPTTVMRSVFGVFALLFATQMALDIKPKAARRLPGRVVLFGVGNMIGMISAIIGIGGGSMTVPFLAWCNVAMKEAVATSAACGLPIAVAGAVGFAVTGWNEADLPVYTTGYIYWPAAAGIVATSVLVAPLGARLAHRLPAAPLKRIFAVLLYILGIRMLLG